MLRVPLPTKALPFPLFSAVQAGYRYCRLLILSYQEAWRELALTVIVWASGPKG
jgi:hypothetical protein